MAAQESHLQEGSRSAMDRRALGEALRTVKDAQAIVDQREHLVSVAEHELKTATQDYDTVSRELAQTQAELQNLEDEIVAAGLPEEAQRGQRIQARNELLQRTLDISDALERATANKQKLFKLLMQRRKDLQAAEREYARLGPLLEETEASLEEQRMFDMEAAQQAVRSEAKLAKAKAKKQQSQSEKAASFQQTLQQRQTAQISQAKAANRDAAQRVNSALRERHETEEQLVQIAVQEDLSKLDGLLQLKDTIAEHSARIQGRNARREKKKQEADRKAAESFDDMLTKGLNPYEVQRKSELAKQFARDTKRREAHIEENKNELAQWMLEEEAALRKQKAIEMRNREHEKKFRDEQARSVVEERHQAYLIEMTDTHTDMLDPTGRASRIDPSKVVTLPDKSFGLGKSSRHTPQQAKAVAEKVRAKIRASDDDLGEYSRLLTTVQKKISAVDTQSTEREKNDIALPEPADATEYSQLVATDVIIPGADPATLLMNALDEVMEAEMSQVDEDRAGQIHQLSKFEKMMHERARERHRKYIDEGTTQVAAGRTYSGQAFVSKPVILEFTDFEVGRTYKKKFRLTNVSYTFNSFKVLDFPHEHADFLTVTFQKPGRMSAGVSCWLELEFKPQLDSDITTEIACSSETGPFSIPVHCRKRRCMPFIRETSLDFGDIVVGERLAVEICIENRGILPTSCEFSFQTTDYIPPVDYTPMDEKAIKRLPSCSTEEELRSRVDGLMTDEVRRRQASNPCPVELAEVANLEGYSTIKHRVTCCPLQIGPIKFTVIATMPEADKEICEATVPIEVTAKGIDLPIYAQDPIVDLGCCLFGRLYRRKTHIMSRGKVPLKVVLRPPAGFEEVLQITPDFAFVQPGEPCEIWLKFTPTPDIVRRARHLSVDQSGIILLPLEVKVPQQSLPVWFIFRAQLSQSALVLQPDLLDFGACFINQQVARTITLYNGSLLPQRYGFANLRPEFDIQPNDGIGILLPEETIDLIVTFKPASTIEYSEQITLFTSLNDVYCIRATGQGLEAPVIFSHSVLALRSTFPGERLVESLTLYNKSDSTHTIELLVPCPKISCLGISPRVVVVPAQSSTRLEIEFFPPGNLSTLLRDQELPETPGVSQPQFDIPSACGKLEYAAIGEPWSVHGRWYIPGYFKPASTGAVSLPPIYLEICTVVVEQELFLELPPESKSPDELYFGQHAVGRRNILTVKLRNNGRHPATIRTSCPFNAVGPFSIVNALRAIHPEVLELECSPSGKRLRLKTRGEGVNPSVSIQPADGILDFGNIMAGDVRSVTCKVKNTCNFTLHFEIERLHEPLLTDAGMPVFLFRPERATVHPGDTVDVTCIFKPEKGRIWPYREDVCVRVPNQAQDIVLRLFARSWDRQLFVIPGDARQEIFNRVPEAHEDALVPASGPLTKVFVPGAPMFMTPPSLPAVRLHFADPFAEIVPAETTANLSAVSVSRTLLVCSIQLSDGRPGAGPGQFEFNLGRKAQASGLFKVSPEKGNVAPGQTVSIAVCFNAAPPRIIGGLDVGQWEIFEATCLLKGGLKPEMEPVDVAIPIEIHAFVRA